MKVSNRQGDLVIYRNSKKLLLLLLFVYPILQPFQKCVTLQKRVQFAVCLHCTVKDLTVYKSFSFHGRSGAEQAVH